MKEVTSTGARGQDITEAARVSPLLGGDVAADHQVVDDADQLPEDHRDPALDLVTQGPAKVGTRTISYYASKYCI